MSNFNRIEKVDFDLYKIIVKSCRQDTNPLTFFLSYKGISQLIDNLLECRDEIKLQEKDRWEQSYHAMTGD
jgi:hypothetical protein